MAFFKVIYAFALTITLGWYLLRSWSKRYVTIIGYRRSYRVGRDSDPAWYWAVLMFYGILEVFFVAILYVQCSSSFRS